MNKVKQADGKASTHATNKQFGKGPGVTNVPLTKSTVNQVQPNATNVKAHAASTPKIAPQATEKKGTAEGRHTVILGNASSQKAGMGMSAPRKDPPHDPLLAGFTRPGKM